MQLTINGKDYELKFGIGFIRELDKVYGIETNGVHFGMGIQAAYPMLTSFSVSALSDIIRCAIKGRLKQESVDEAIEAYADENDGLAGLFEAVKDELGKSSVTKDLVKKSEVSLEEAEEKLKEKE